MAIYEMRTCTLNVGAMGPAVKLLTAAPWGPHP